MNGIVETVALVSHTIDAKRWDELRALFADEVATDYSSLFGSAPQTQPADALIEDWKRALTGVTTHHLLGPVIASDHGQRAGAECHVRALHRAEGASSGSDWDVLGHYAFELILGLDRVWRISALRLTVHLQVGNRRLLDEVEQSRSR